MSEQFDAIVVGSGMTGGWAAKELCERGLKVLLLERGRHVEHAGPEYSDMKAPWETEHRDLVPEIYDAQGRYAMLKRKGWTYNNEYLRFFVDEADYPYSYPPERPFMWTRGYQLGGRSLTWSRQTYRWGPKDFLANARDGHGVAWPIGYDDLAPWYGHIERFIGVSGASDGIETLPESHFQPPFELSIAEQVVAERLSKAMPDRRLIIGRCAHLTEPTTEQIDLGRVRCQARNHCMRGCTYGAYFSSLSATLPAARRTGNLTTVTGAIVHSLTQDSGTGRITGVRVVGHDDMKHVTYTSRIVFLCASAVASVQIMLNSGSDAAPNGLANSSGLLGRYIMDHVGDATASGEITGLEDRYAFGRRPTGFYIPNYRHEQTADVDFIRGYGYQGAGSDRPDTGTGWDKPGVGADAKAKARQPAPWRIGMGMFGEMLPYADNRATLHPTRKDRWGIPLIHLDCTIRENERKMIRQARLDAVAMLEAGGCVSIQSRALPEDEHMLVGGKTHEMGGACMGSDPTASVLNGWAQAHDAPNLFVTDGACMSSCSTVNPSLTYMAITARASARAADLLKAGAI